MICANAIPATLEEAEADDDKYQTLTRCIDVLLTCLSQYAFCFCNSQTVSCYYRVMMIELVNHLKKVRTISEVKCVLHIKIIIKLYRNGSFIHEMNISRMTIWVNIRNFIFRNLLAS